MVKINSWVGAENKQLGRSRTRDGNVLCPDTSPVHNSALPSDWSTGSVKGICGRNGFSVDMTWQEGKLARAVIHSNLGQPCQVRYDGKTTKLSLSKGESVEIDGNLNSIK